MPDQPVGAALRLIRERLKAAGVPASGLEARLLIEIIAGLSPVDILTRPDRPLPSVASDALDAAMERRLRGEPLHRILGWREFYGLRLALSPETLEPRPDTETLVDAVLPFVRERAAHEGGCRILDLGTGTGAIALALLSQVERAEAVGADVAEGALETAAANARSLGLESRFQALRSDWFGGVSSRFALIVSNPPYITHEELHQLPPAVARFDPARALDGGADGLDAYRVLATESAGRLEAGGRIAVEIGHLQREAVTELFRQHGFRRLEAHRDFAGNDRVLVFETPENAAKA